MMPAPGRPRFRPDLLVLAVLMSVAVGLFVRVRLPPDVVPGQTEAPPEIARNPPRHVQDFAYYFNYARRAAARPGVSPYSYEEHRNFLRTWFGPKVRSALCFAYSPTLVVLFAPLFPFAAAWAWVAWNVVGSWLTACAVAALAGGDRAALRSGRFAAIGLTAFHTLVNGQTALVTTGCFGALMHFDRVVASSSLGVVGCVASVVALSAKPPLAIVALVALLLAGRTRVAVAGAAGIAAIAALSMVWWTPAIVWDYAGLVGRYNLVEADEVVRAGFVPRAMSNLRAVLLQVGPDDARAFAVSGWTFGLVLAAPLVASLVRPAVWSLDVAVGWTVMAYLLFVPHLSPTEDLLALVPLVTLVRAPATRVWERPALVAGCIGPQWINGTSAHVLGLAWTGWEIAAPIAGFALKLLPAVVVCARAAEFLRPRART